MFGVDVFWGGRIVGHKLQFQGVLQINRRTMEGWYV